MTRKDIKEFSNAGNWRIALYGIHGFLTPVFWRLVYFKDKEHPKIQTFSEFGFIYHNPTRFYRRVKVFVDSQNAFVDYLDFLKYFQGKAPKLELPTVNLKGIPMDLNINFSIKQLGRILGVEQAVSQVSAQYESMMRQMAEQAQEKPSNIIQL